MEKLVFRSFVKLKRDIMIDWVEGQNRVKNENQEKIINRNVEKHIFKKANKEAYQKIKIPHFKD